MAKYIMALDAGTPAYLPAFQNGKYTAEYRTLIYWVQARY